MIRILIFTILKLLEISAIIFIPYSIGSIVKCSKWLNKDVNAFTTWTVGFAGLATLLLIFFLLLALVELCIINWHWAGSFLSIFTR